MLGGSLLVGPIAGSSAGPYDIEYLAVSGGGAGGSRYYGGGGGAGGYLTSTLSQIPAKTVMTITVGTGGVGTSNGYGGSGTVSSIAGTGITTVAPAGGGGGGGSTSGGSSNRHGRNGASGGGPRGWSTSGSTEGTGIAGQGFMSGSADTSLGNYTNPTFVSANYLSAGWGAGGGGASEKGHHIHYLTNLSTPGAGGDGKTFSIDGNSTYYAGGGGGGWNANSNSTQTYNAYSDGLAPGGAGGGGKGGRGYYSPSIVATAGAANKGGGGGGGSHSGSTTGGNGGSGVVLIKVPEGNYSGIVTGSPTVTTSGGYTYIKFTGSGTYTT